MVAELVTIEQIERADWGLTDQDEATDRRDKAISGYYLNRWYEAIKHWTFQTEIYELAEYQPDHSDQDQHYRDRLSRVCPETLPFAKCMVRFESKSPKDSELWGPVTTKAEVIELFYTSLRCRREPGRYLCIRKWQDNLGLEYRCFWNHGLVAVGLREPDLTISAETIVAIIYYINSIASRIPYHRCVFDLVTISNYGAPLCNYKIIEFNSWETNCGAAPFDWQDDSDILYPVIPPLSSTRSTIFRTITSAVTGQSNQPDYQIYQDDYGTTVGCYTTEVRDPRFRDLEVTQDCPLAKYPDNYVEITPETILTPLPHQPGQAILVKMADIDYLYLASDIYLYRFQLQPAQPSGYTVKVRNWVRGVFRFDDLFINPVNNIEAGGKVYHHDLTPLRKAIKPSRHKMTESRHQLADRRYGFVALDQTGQEIFVQISSTGQLYTCIP